MAVTEIVKNKKYQVRVYYRNELNEPRDISRIVNGTEKDANRIELEISDTLSKGAKYDITFKELFDFYLTNKEKANEETLRKAREIYTTYLSSLDRRKVKSLNLLTINELRKSIQEKNGSVTQKNKAIYILKGMIKTANIYYGADDYSQNISPIKKLVRDKFIYHTYTPEEFEYVLAFVTGDNYKLIYELYFWTGLRRGEALALSPRDLLKSKDINVNKSLNSYNIIGPPKNEKSYRKVKLHDDLYNRLLPYSQSKGISLFGGMKYLPPSTINGRFTRAIKRANKKRKQDGLYQLPHIRIHDLRHSHASYLASQGIPITAVSSRLGHASVSETMETYLHLFKGDDDRIVDLINSEKTPTKTPTSDEKL